MYPLKINEKYDLPNLANLWRRFTTLYTGNYLPGDMRIGVGSHPGVDIVPPVKNAPVYACLDGEVVMAENKGSYGNIVVLKHEGTYDPADFTKKTTLFSCHLHLSEIDVKKGDQVSEGTQIGKTGNTGNSTGEHLHFQIDRAESPYHAYWPFTGAEQQAAKLDFMGAVNAGLGLDNVYKYTIDPLVYLDKVDAYRNNSTPITPKVVSPVIETPKPVAPKAEVKIETPVVTTAKVEVKVETPKVVTPKVETPTIKVASLDSSVDVISADGTVQKKN
ncbi:MAG: M23 family metallopeptidase [Candidatus Gracilibacteria bacterium]|nr:M23 family metallopeptidase [Candidatus Gracilibacteria bacterium]